jgi:pimeloyl-ACP methyl ester carboxylesterase
MSAELFADVRDDFGVAGRFDDLGHVPHEEDPARTVAVVSSFLALNPP